MEAGKRLRETVPRLSHGIWKKPAGRADPIAMLQASDPERLAELLPVRYGRMLVSPFTFYRGAAGVMAADLATTPATGLRVQACGDCHLLNFGGFATPERNIIFDINDFDETLPAPWEWDVKRLAASSCSPRARTACPMPTGAMPPRRPCAATVRGWPNTRRWRRWRCGMRASTTRTSSA